VEPNLVKISPVGAQSWWSSFLVEPSPDGGAQFGIRVVSGWYQDGIGVVSGWYQGGIRVYQGGIRVVSVRVVSWWYQVVCGCLS
jgi:hypothetical protein